jgi:hypothetical protein
VLAATCAVLSGADSCVEIEASAREKLDWLREYWPRTHGIPCHHTFVRLIKYARWSRKRMAERHGHVCEPLDGLHAPERWPALKSMALISSERRPRERPPLRSGFMLHISSLPPDAQRMKQTVHQDGWDVSGTVCTGAWRSSLAMTRSQFPFTATRALNVAPAANLGTVISGIWIFSPVFGFLPSRAARVLALKEPNPTSVTVSPLATASTTASVAASSAFVAAVFDRSERAAMASINSDLFISSPKLVVDLSGTEYRSDQLVPEKVRNQAAKVRFWHGIPAINKVLSQIFFCQRNDF